jgi:hypothetical protein
MTSVYNWQNIDSCLNSYQQVKSASGARKRKDTDTLLVTVEAHGP